MTMWNAKWYADAPGTPEFSPATPSIAYDDVQNVFLMNGVSMKAANIVVSTGTTFNLSDSFFTTASIVIATMHTGSSTYIISAVPGNGSCLFTFSASLSGTNVVSYVAYSGNT